MKEIVMIFNANTASVDASALAEAGIGIEVGAGTAAVTPVLTTSVAPALDADSLAFITALNASGAAYAAVSTEHVAQRAAYSGAQALASTAIQANEAIGAAANAIA
jgi:hypothetical protein